MPVQTGRGCFLKFSKSQNHASLTLLDGIKTGSQPDTGKQYQHHQYTSDTKRFTIAASAAAAAAASTTTPEEATEFFLQIFYDLIEIRRTVLVILVSPGIFSV